MCVCECECVCVCVSVCVCGARGGARGGLQSTGHIFHPRFVTSPRCVVVVSVGLYRHDLNSIPLLQKVAVAHAHHTALLSDITKKGRKEGSK